MEKELKLIEPVEFDAFVKTFSPIVIEDIRNFSDNPVYDIGLGRSVPVLAGLNGEFFDRKTDHCGRLNLSDYSYKIKYNDRNEYESIIYNVSMNFFFNTVKNHEPICVKTGKRTLLEEMQKIKAKDREIYSIFCNSSDMKFIMGNVGNHIQVIPCDDFISPNHACVTSNPDTVGYLVVFNKRRNNIVAEDCSTSGEQSCEINAFIHGTDGVSFFEIKR